MQMKLDRKLKTQNLAKTALSVYLRKPRTLSG